MDNGTPYADKKEAIRGELLRCARDGRTLFYGELGRLVGIPPRGPWKPILDEIAREERGKGLSDITFLVSSKSTGFPGQIGFEPAHPPTAEQRRKADEVLKSVFAKYRQANHE